MRKNGLLAAAYMRDLAKARAAGVKGMCLKTCRTAWGLPGGYPDAIAAWNSVPAKHRHNDPNTAPVGAPHFWGPKKIKGIVVSGRHGHIAIQAEHEGFVWSTDLPTVDRVGLIDLDLVTKKWGMPYLGWSSELQDQVLPLGPEAPKE